MLNKVLIFLLPLLFSVAILVFSIFNFENFFDLKDGETESFYRSGYVAVTEVKVLDGHISRASSHEEYLLYKDLIIETAGNIVKNSEIVAQKCDETVSVRLKLFSDSISSNIEQLLPEEIDEEVRKTALLKIKTDSWKLRDIIEHGLKKRTEEALFQEEQHMLKLKKWFLYILSVMLIFIGFLTAMGFYYFAKSSNNSKVIKTNEFSSEESDETQRKFLREQIVSKRKSALLDMIPYGIFSSDMNGRLTYINKKMSEWFDVSESSAGDSVDTVLKMMGLEDINKEKFVFNGNIYWLFSQEISKEIFYLVRNITDQEELARKLLDSERLVSIGEMASRITHEIRNPLSTIKLNSEYLAENVVELDDAQISASIELIVKEVVRLESITDKYMDMVRYRSHDESEVSASLPVDLFQLISFHMPEFEKRKIDLKVEKCEECTVSITLSSFKEIVLNLFKNAWEELSDGGTVLVNGNIAGNKITITIEDSGKGILETEREDVFKNFFTKKPGGTGIGLSHSRKLAVEAGGRLYVSDSKIGGACLVLELPVKLKNL